MRANGSQSLDLALDRTHKTLREVNLAAYLLGQQVGADDVNQFHLDVEITLRVKVQEIRKPGKTPSM